MGFMGLGFKTLSHASHASVAKTALVVPLMINYQYLSVAKKS
jgi:hypothetical protein